MRKMIAVDFHCHLDLYPDPARVVDQIDRDNSYVLSVTTTPKAWHGTAMLAGANPRIKTALGLHPQLAHKRISELDLFDSLISETRYIGEVGLDGTAEFSPHWQAQVTVFDHILASSARNGGRIMSIHSRRSAGAVLDAIEKHPYAGIAVFHWFSGTKTELMRAIELGCWFSVGSAMVKAKNGRELIAAMPRNRVITETDGPFGSVKGKSLQPGDINDARKTLAQCWTVDEVEASNTVLDSFRRLVAMKVGGRR